MIHPIGKTPCIMSSEEKGNFFIKWINILNLPRKRIHINNNLNSKKGFIASIYSVRNIITKEINLTIQIYPIANKLEFIHELGHPFFRLQLGIDPFFNPSEKPDPDILYLVNVIEDVFVNYRLCKFDEFYQLLVNEFKRIEMNIPEGTFAASDCFINSFVCPVSYFYMFKLHDRKRSKIPQWVDNILNTNGNIFALKKEILKKIEVFGMKKFKILKDSNNKENYYKFVFDMIRLSNLYSDKEIKASLYSIYGFF